MTVTLYRAITSPLSEVICPKEVGYDTSPLSEVICPKEVGYDTSPLSEGYKPEGSGL